MSFVAYTYVCYNTGGVVLFHTTVYEERDIISLQEEEFTSQPLSDLVASTTLKLPQHHQCAAHLLEQIAAVDLPKLIDSIPDAAKSVNRALAKTRRIWDKYYSRPMVIIYFVKCMLVFDIQI